MDKNLGGRPSVYSKEIEEEIVTRLAGGESLRSICRDEHMPAISSVLLWVVKDEPPGFRNIYTRAREAQGYSDADNIREIVRMVKEGEVEPNAAKVMMDGCKWTAERNAPKVYGARIAQEISGPDGVPLPNKIEIVAG